MYFSAEWLSRYVELPDSIDKLAELLTRCGMVVDGQRRHGTDTVFDLDIPSNRVDAMNHVGVAREIAAARRVELRLPDADAEEAGPTIDELTSVAIDDLEGCPRYCARLVRGVSVAPSPPWLVALLEAIGLRPLNNVADITNFVLWELGHPLHAFDFDQLAERRIVVRRAREGETLVTLDDVERALLPADVVIADAEVPVALAGVMGGADSAISAGSTDVLLEGAWFDPVAVRRTGQRLNLHTDARHRFERTPAHDGMLAALDRAAALVVELAGGELAPGTIDITGELPGPVSAVLRSSRLRELLGIEIAGEDIEDILGRLGFRLTEIDGGYRVEVPSYRPDVTLEEDLIEEVGRHYGYDRLPATLPVIRGTEEPATREVIGEWRLKRSLVAAGCTEAMSSSLSSVDEQAVFTPRDDLVAVANPISESLGVLRALITPGMLAGAAHNVNHGQSSLRLFELGRCFSGPLNDDGVVERWGLGIVLTGKRRAAHWNAPADAVDFFDLKGLVDGLAQRLAWPGWAWRAGERAGLVAPTTATIRSLDGNIAAGGWAGKLAPEAADRFGIEVDVWLAELDIDALLPRPHPTARYRPLSRFPGGARDVALVLPRDVAYATVEHTVREAATGADLPLADSALVEVYEGDEIPANSRGMTLRFVFRADDRTLTADEIDAGEKLLVERLAEACDARRR